MQMLFESSFSFCTQQVTTRLQSGEAATAGEEGVNRTVARQSSRAATAGVHHGGPRGAHAEEVFLLFFFHHLGGFSNANEADETRGPRPYGQGLRFLTANAAAAAARARGNEINTAMRPNAPLTCRLVIF